MSDTTDIWRAIQKTDRLVFRTREMAQLTNSQLSLVSQQLARLEKKGVIKKNIRGLWAVISDRRFSPFMVVPFLSFGQQSYVSFVSALHIYGMISQIPQIITVASTMHSRTIRSSVGTYLVHQIEPGFFTGFEWSKSGNFLIATPEKTLMDCLYISARRGNRYQFFPELEFPKNFSKKRARQWLMQISDARLRKSVSEKLEAILYSVHLTVSSKKV